MTQCNGCKGQGIIECGYCMGMGDDMETGEECQPCHGTGEIHCGACGGSGVRI